jgi:GT2 family glycosyltransferase
MARRSLFDAIGNFDEKNFPIYLSEADFSERMKSRGFHALVVPSAVVWHDVPALAGIRSLLRHIHITEPSRAYYVARNRIIFVKKYRKLWQKLLFMLFFLPMIAALHSVTILASRHAHRVYLIRNYLGGVIDGLASR